MSQSARLTSSSRPSTLARDMPTGELSSVRRHSCSLSESSSTTLLSLHRPRSGATLSRSEAPEWAKSAVDEGSAAGEGRQELHGRAGLDQHVVRVVGGDGPVAHEGRADLEDVGQPGARVQLDGSAYDLGEGDR